MTLDLLLTEIKENFIKSASMNEINLNKTILTKAIAGDTTCKNSIKAIINRYISENVDDEDINKLIKEYHVNYFEPIYVGSNKLFISIFNKFIINENDDIEIRKDKLTQIVYQEVYGLSVIDDFADGNITGLNEISTNSYDYISLQISGVRKRIPKLKFKDEKMYQEVVKKSISFKPKLDLKPDNPEVLCQRLNGERVTALCPPYSHNYSLNIRYFSATLITKHQLIGFKTSNEDIETTLDNIMPGRPNIFVLGDQGTGKTTYVLRLMGSIPDNISIATLEPMFELNPDRYYPQKDIKKLQFLSYKTPDDAFQTCLRLNRDIIITGEVRSPQEAVITLNSMTRQNKGSMGTFHTVSPEDFIYDYKNLLMQNGTYTNELSALYDISRAVDFLIMLGINRKTGQRYIKSITEVIFDKSNKEKPYELNTIFKYDKKNKEFKKVNKISDSFFERAFEFEFDENNKKIIDDIFS
ncbi:ATPase, T2SS/T4P/T4SS family [Clostridium sporogenes]|uniref:Type II/IV secretion system family protein n=1 Tax=Clostridium sporogenes TaxID=1509 RepID=A0A1J1CSS2_CLOSG|nr:ATPase, T2SS/T4P/T4SS family [Clostridium sporogenes]APF25329.1 type II/IV secretion system family protein [Clostridium sporogenes]APH16366.1 type II/IV secretion system family protein [Clostridium sporogenes]